DRHTLKGWIPAIPTPFDEAGNILETAFRDLLERYISYGVDGICVAGDNGESWNLSVDERRRLTELAVDQARGRIPVISGATAPGSKQTIAYAEAAKESGAAAVLVMPQISVLKASRDELLRRFEALDRAVDLPIIAYNSPRRSGIELSLSD